MTRERREFRRVASTGALALFAALAAIAVHADAPAPVARSVDEVFAREVVRVAPRIHAIVKPAVTVPPFEGNVVVFEQRDGLVVVDTGGSTPSGRIVARAIESISAKPVRYIVQTHYHGDHTLGTRALLDRWPQAVAISTTATQRNVSGAPMRYIANYANSYAGLVETARRNAADASRPASERDGWQRVVAAGPAMVEAYSTLVAVPATRTFERRLTLPDPDVPLEVRFLGRGNTDGDAIVWAPKQRVVASGDLVVAPVPYAAHTYPGEWLEVLKALDALPWTTLVPGHGDVQHDRSYLRELIATLTEVRRRVRERGDVSLDELRADASFESVRRRYAGDDGWLRFLVDAVFLRDLISNAYKEAHGQEVVQGVG